MDMTKYIKVTGVGGTTNTVIPCNQVCKILRDGGAPYNIVRIEYFDTDGDAKLVRLETAFTTEALNVAICNFLADKIVEALQLPYEKPMLEIPADGFPSPIISVQIQ
jgi:hypothetical protein